MKKENKYIILGIMTLVALTLAVLNIFLDKLVTPAPNQMDQRVFCQGHEIIPSLVNSMTDSLRELEKQRLFLKGVPISTKFNVVAIVDKKINKASMFLKSDPEGNLLGYCTKMVSLTIKFIDNDKCVFDEGQVFLQLFGKSLSLLDIVREEYGSYDKIRFEDSGKPPDIIMGWKGEENIFRCLDNLICSLGPIIERGIKL